MLRLVSLSLLVVAVAPAPVVAQVAPFSQRGSVAQTVSFTDITITYSRPVARGRDLFPGVVKWDRVWNPGADSATMIRIGRDVLIEGQRVAAGEYSLWMIPAAQGPWTVILSRAAHVFHTPYPGEEHDALRLRITPETGAHMETLAFYFPVVVREQAVLRMHWGTTIVPLRIEAPAPPA